MVLSRLSSELAFDTRRIEYAGAGSRKLSRGSLVSSSVDEQIKANCGC